MVDEKKESDKWLRLAEENLDAAKYNFDGEKFSVAVFLCHQVVEKGLKALMIKRGKGLVKIHDLVKLGKEVGLPEKFFDVSARLSVLYTNVRYPVVEEFGKKEVDSFIKFAEEVLEWIKEKI